MVIVLFILVGRCCGGDGKLWFCVVIFGWFETTDGWLVGWVVVVLFVAVQTLVACVVFRLCWFVHGVRGGVVEDDGGLVSERVRDVTSWRLRRWLVVAVSLAAQC